MSIERLLEGVIKKEQKVLVDIRQRKINKENRHNDKMLALVDKKTFSGEKLSFEELEFVYCLKDPNNISKLFPNKEEKERRKKLEEIGFRRGALSSLDKLFPTDKKKVISNLVDICLAKQGFVGNESDLFRDDDFARVAYTVGILGNLDINVGEKIENHNSTLKIINRMKNEGPSSDYSFTRQIVEEFGH